MQVVNVDPVGAETLQARVARGENPTARKSAIVRRLRHDVADFGREDPTIALSADRRADDHLGCASRVDVGRIDEVDAGILSMRDDRVRCRRIGAIAEHHRAETNDGNFEPAFTETAELHRERSH